jgi:hypothetical protein
MTCTATTSEIIERPVLFNAQMVRAILDGRKTQTRRLMNPQPEIGMLIRGPVLYEPVVIRNGDERPGKPIFGCYDDDGEWGVRCPLGAPGDRLWVRESFEIESFGAGVAQIRYKADEQRGPTAGVSDRKLPNRLGGVNSIHMPRHCSRLTLEVIDVRIERLQKITEKDAFAEGVHLHTDDTTSPVRSFRTLWDSLYGNWDDNRWVWVVEFKPIL